LVGSAATETSFEDRGKTTGSWPKEIASNTSGWFGPNMTAPSAIPRPARGAACSNELSIPNGRSSEQGFDVLTGLVPVGLRNEKQINGSKFRTKLSCLAKQYLAGLAQHCEDVRKELARSATRTKHRLG
jgi:hypothetical protein